MVDSGLTVKSQVSTYSSFLRKIPDLRVLIPEYRDLGVLKGQSRSPGDEIGRTENKITDLHNCKKRQFREYFEHLLQAEIL